MQSFAEQLLLFMQAHMFKRSDLYRSLNMDRSTFSQILSGKRLPSSPEIVDQISVVMSLTDEERIILMEAWKIEKTGALVYYRRKQVRSFLECCIEGTLNHLNKLPNYKGNDLDHSDRPLPDYHSVINGKKETLRVIQHILKQESTASKGRIALISQEEHLPIAQLLQNLSAENPFQFDLILRLQETDRLSSDGKLMNLSLFSLIIPLYEIPMAECHTFYYYNDNIDNTNFFPRMSCLLLTQTCSFNFQPDLEKGILYTDKKCVALFWNLFQKCRQACSLLVQPIPATRDNYATSMTKGDIFTPAAQDKSVSFDKPETQGFPDTQRFAICINKQNMTILYNKLIFALEESSLLNAFRDFLFNEEENHLLSTKTPG